MRETNKHFQAITRDGVAVAIISAGESTALAWFHSEHSYSMDHALEFEGYGIVNDSILVNGWVGFDKLATRRGGGIAGHAARTLRSLHALTVENVGVEDYVFEGMIGAQLDALEGMIGYLEGSAASIAHELAKWIQVTRIQYGIEAS